MIRRFVPFLYLLALSIPTTAKYQLFWTWEKVQFCDTVDLFDTGFGNKYFQMTWYDGKGFNRVLRPFFRWNHGDLNCPYASMPPVPPSCMHPPTSTTAYEAYPGYTWTPTTQSISQTTDSWAHNVCAYYKEDDIDVSEIFLYLKEPGTPLVEMIYMLCMPGSKSGSNYWYYLYFEPMMTANPTTRQAWGSFP